MANTEQRKPALYEKVAEDLIKKLEQGTAPWQKPWDVSNVPVLPYNATTGNNYKGLNTFALMMEDRGDPRWMTFKQAADNNWSVKKGEKGTLINFYKFDEQKALRDEAGNPQLDEQGKQKYITVKRENPIITAAWVFNAEQVSGVPELVREPVNNWKAIGAVEAIVKESGAIVKHTGGNQAFYSPGRDLIELPVKDAFAEPGLYYATLLHELGHWTGHDQRLDRPLLNKFGTEEYAKEELRAEIGSLMLGTDLQIGHDPERHASYVASWIEVLKNDPFEIHRAAADAQKIFDYVKGFQQELKLENKENMQPVAGKVATSKKTLVTGEAIGYKDDVYTVLEKLKPGTFKMQSTESNRVFILKSTDNLYTNLLRQKEQQAKQAVDRTSKSTNYINTNLIPQKEVAVIQNGDILLSNNGKQKVDKLAKQLSKEQLQMKFQHKTAY